MSKQVMCLVGAAVVALSAVAAAQTPDPSLVGWWKLDEAFGAVAVDSSGHGNNGTVYGTATWAPGIVAGALQFDGATYVDCGYSASLNLSGSVSVSAWVNMNSSGTDIKVAGNQDWITGGYKLGVYSNNRAEFEIRTPDNRAILNRDSAGGTVLQQGVWYHVVGVYSQGQYIRTYLNGELDRELLTTEVLGSSTGTLKLGCEPATGGLFWMGTLDDVRVYSRALDAEEIGTAMRPSSSGLIAHWPMNENGGSVVADVAGGFNGTLVGNVVWTPGETGCALRFPGVPGNNVNLGKVPINLGSRFTLACWIKLRPVSTWHVILAKGPKDAGHYELYVNGAGLKGEAAAYLPDLGDFGSGIRVDDGTWHHITWTYDGNSMTCYVDGVGTGLKTWSVRGRSVAAETEEFRIGSLADGSTFPFGGEIDDVRIYNRALNTAEIATAMRPSVTPLPTVQPSSSTQCPAVSTQCPTVSTQCPVVSTACPACPVTVQPAVSTQCPTVSTQCPVVSTTCPACPVTVQPAASTMCQTVSTQCPLVSTQCPTSSTRCPAVSTQCPAETTRCPATATSCSSVPIATVCPPRSTHCPVVSTRCPETNTKCPAETTRCPAEATWCPRETTKCPAVEYTVCPLQTTHCPQTTTKCPTESTRCPVHATSCPTESTKCPAQTTKCPLWSCLPFAPRPEALSRSGRALETPRLSGTQGLVRNAASGSACPIVETTVPTVVVWGR